MTYSNNRFDNQEQYDPLIDVLQQINSTLRKQAIRQQEIVDELRKLNESKGN